MDVEYLAVFEIEKDLWNRIIMLTSERYHCSVIITVMLHRQIHFFKCLKCRPMGFVSFLEQRKQIN